MKVPRSAYGPCYVCQKEVHIFEFECGHVISHADGGNLDVGNLRPVCGSCNKSMGKTFLFDYVREKFPAYYPQVQEDELLFKFRQLKVKEVNKFLSQSDYEESSSFDEDEVCEHENRKGERCNASHFKYGFCRYHINEAFNLGRVKETSFPPKNRECQFVLLKGKNKGSICGKDSIRHGFCQHHLYKVFE